MIRPQISIRKQQCKGIKHQWLLPKILVALPEGFHRDKKDISLVKGKGNEVQ